MATPAPMSYEQAPPFSLPLRFFLTAPLFAVAAGGLIVWDAGGLFASRWMPATLALTHLITLGFMLMVMLGGLLQVLPVVMGVQLWAVRRLGAGLHVALCAGAALLPLAFLLGTPALFVAAAAALGLAVGLFLLAALPGVLAVVQASPTTLALKASLFGLALTLGLGLALALGFGWGWSLPYPALTDLHAAWGLLAWGGLLLAALSYLVVPMFQLTPPYPGRLPPLLLGLVLAGVLGWSLALLLEWPWLVSAAVLLLALAGATYAVQTLRLQARRRRARKDAGFWFWQLGLYSFLLAAAMPPLALIFPAWAALAWWPLVFGGLVGAGGFLSLMTGMLYKIVPFLAWLHLQDLGRARRKVPSMAALLPENRMRWQFAMHTLAVVGLLLACLWPKQLAPGAGLLLMVSSLSLFGNLSAAAMAYRRAMSTGRHRQIANNAADDVSDKR